MTEWLYALPDLVIVAAFIVLFGGAVAFLPRLLALYPSLKPNAESTDFVLRIQSTLFTMTGFALAFTLVQAQANYRRVEGIVTSEAAQINTLDRLLTRYGDPSVTALRPILLGYIESIVKDDWPELVKGRQSPETIARFAATARAVAGIQATPGRQSSLYSEMLKSLENMAESRDARLDAGKVALPTVYWIVVWFAMGVLVAASGTIIRTRFRTFFLTAQAAVLGALMAVVFITDHPLKGETSVGPDAFVRVIAAIKNRSN